MNKEMKTLYRLAATVLIIALVVISYLLSTERPGVPSKTYDHSNIKLPIPQNTDKFLKEEISEKQHAAIQSEWDKFLGNNNGARHHLVLEEEEEEDEGKDKSDKEKEPDLAEEDQEWEKYLAKHPTSKTIKKVKPDNSPKVVQEDKVDPKYIARIKKIDYVKAKKKKLKMKIILIYTELHKKTYWYNLGVNETKGYLKRTKCPNTKCHITYDKDLFSLADAVVFHERNMPSLPMLKSLSRPGRRPTSQRWIYFTSETPKNSASTSVPFNELFNWTMTYRLDSDIFLPYLQYRRLEKGEKPPPVINYAKTKNSSATIAWLVSNCNFELRMKFVTLLERETKVYVGGSCRDNYVERMPCTPWCDLNVVKQYKFFLSFENGICTDYITEKYWKYLELGLVPVVLGGANYSDPRLAIPGSFIDASKFHSVKSLASYLDYLSKNDTAYNEYFEWKQKYKIWHPPKGDWPFESYFLCEICKKLHQNLPKKVYKKLSDFWNIQTDCQLPEDEIMERFIPKDFDKGMLDEEEIRRQKDSKENIPKDFDEE